MNLSPHFNDDIAAMLTARAKNNAKSKAWRDRNLEKAREYTRKWRAKDPGRANAMARVVKSAWMAKPENRIRHCLGAAKRRALAAGMEFDITVDDLLPLPSSCPVLGVPLNYGGTGANGFVNNSPSIDRIDSFLGYVKGNVQVISWRANRLKADATIDELRALLTYMEEKACN